MPEYSESFYITVAGIGAGLGGLALYYFRSTLLTSRCSDIACCWGCVAIKNNPVSEEEIEGILAADRPPTPAPQAPPPVHRETHNGHLRSHYTVSPQGGRSRSNLGLTEPIGPDAV